jgi:hypothetical protein
LDTNQHPDFVPWQNLSRYDDSVFTKDSLGKMENSKAREKLGLLGMQKRWHEMQRDMWLEYPELNPEMV